jgi:hypothetical protein
VKYPLKWRHEFVRDMTCWFKGHHWTCTPRRHTEYFGKHSDEVPYLYRRGTGLGNYMFEDVAWWSSKCRRCRIKTREWPWDSAHVTAIRAFKYSMREIKWSAKYVLEETEASLIKKLLFIPPVAIISALNTFFVQFDRLPSSVWVGLSNCHDWLWERLTG